MRQAGARLPPGSARQVARPAGAPQSATVSADCPTAPPPGVTRRCLATRHDAPLLPACCHCDMPCPASHPASHPATHPSFSAQYYSLDISFFKSSLDSHLLDLLWNK